MNANAVASLIFIILPNSAGVKFVLVERVLHCRSLFLLLFGHDLIFSGLMTSGVHVWEQSIIFFRRLDNGNMLFMCLGTIVQVSKFCCLGEFSVAFGALLL